MSEYTQTRNIALVNQENLNEITKSVSMLNRSFTKIVENDNYQDMTLIEWDKFAEKKNTTLEIANQVTYEPLKADFKYLKKIMKEADENKDMEKILEAHKIIHDLHYFLFQGHSNKVYHNATITLDGVVNNNKIIK
ncbi:hypothetical protein PRVXT_002058 [Proteinivorax tanatarense]|uniref:Uncharacterized protein n=1 Tax=Proteinivorax tanatarense TaxID=1260629 RepID=A0AAU7VIT0_9FIRM